MLQIYSTLTPWVARPDTALLNTLSDGMTAQAAAIRYYQRGRPRVDGTDAGVRSYELRLWDTNAVLDELHS